MSIIKWRDSYNTGVEQFDREHHKLVELIGVMFEVVRDKSGKEMVQQAYQDILSYTEYHFANEEQAMEAANYPDFEEHLAAHAKLKNEVQKFQASIENNFLEGSAEFYHFLRNWLIDHILNCDQKYGPCLKNRADADHASR